MTEDEGEYSEHVNELAELADIDPEVVKESLEAADRLIPTTDIDPEELDIELSDELPQELQEE